MADKKDKKEKKGKEEKPATGKTALPLPVLILGGIVALAVLPATLIFVVGMVPSLIMAMTDSNPKRNLTVAVAALNLTSVFYMLLQLVRLGYGLETSFALVSQPFNWLIMWGGAAVGLALHKFIPPTVAQVLATLAEARIVKLKTNQEELKKNWGDGVGS
jgi:hypothetical protein